MRLILLLAVLSGLSIWPSTARARTGVTTGADTAAVDSTSKPSRFYFGGGIGLSVSGRITWISVQPVLGYKLTRTVSTGVRARYEHMSDRRSTRTETWNNYGGSVFTRWRFHPQAFAQVEHEQLGLDSGSGRAWVPFLLVGGGYVRTLGPKTSLTVEMLFDLLQDERAGPYRDQSPRVNVGVGVGF